LHHKYFYRKEAFRKSKSAEGQDLMHPLNKAYKRPAVASIGNTTATRNTHEKADNYLETRICTDYNNIYLERCRLRSILKCLAEK
jgi:hypothetical protein